MTLEDIKSKNEESVEEFKLRMKGYMSQEMYEDDSVFYRFLRARNYDIDAAELMLRNHLKWRKVNDVDSILTSYTPPEFLESKYFALDNLGYDVDGSLVGYSHFGSMDSRGILKTVTRYDIEKYVMQFIEANIIQLKEHTEKREKLVENWVYIFNFENFSFATATHKPTLETLAGLATMYDANYPERLKAAYFINASIYFTMGWRVVKPFLSAQTVQKIKIFGKVGWQEELLKSINPDILPSFLGGNLSDPNGDPRCSSLIRLGGKVPESLFVWKNKDASTRIPGAQKLVINRMSKSEVSLQVLYPNSHIEWEFSVKAKDICFSLHFRENNNSISKAKVIIPHQRIETSLSAETGMVLCKAAGIYVIEFDNTYSWIHNKEIYYKVSVVNPRKQKPGV